MSTANAHIQHYAQDLTVTFDKRARNHVVQIARAINRSLAKNHIQIKQFPKLQQILTTRKQRQSGKHNILRGETIIATPEMLQRLEEAEAETQSRKSKRRKLTAPTNHRKFGQL